MNIRHNMSVMYKMWLYDFLYFAADLLIKLRNPCEIHHEKEDLPPIECPICRLLSQPDKVVCISNGPCCEGCQHLGDNGCTVKCLKCKLWICKEASIKHPKLTHLLRIMETIANKQNSSLLWMRVPRERIYQHLKRRRW